MPVSRVCFTKNQALFSILNGPPWLSVNQREKVRSGDQGDLSWVSAGYQFAGSLQKPTTIAKVPGSSSRPWTECGHRKSWAHTLVPDKLIPDAHCFPEWSWVPYLAICENHSEITCCLTTCRKIFHRLITCYIKENFLWAIFSGLPVRYSFAFISHLLLCRVL